MKYSFLLLSFLLIISCSSKNDEVETLKEQVADLQSQVDHTVNMTPEERALRDKANESNNARDYITFSAKTEQQLFANDELKVTITNTSKYLTFKNFAIKVSYYTKTDAFIKSFNKTIFDYVTPQTTKSFKFRMQDYPSEMASYRAIIDQFEVE